MQTAPASVAVPGWSSVGRPFMECVPSDVHWGDLNSYPAAHLPGPRPVHRGLREEREGGRNQTAGSVGTIGVGSTSVLTKWLCKTQHSFNDEPHLKQASGQGVPFRIPV